MKLRLVFRFCWCITLASILAVIYAEADDALDAGRLFFYHIPNPFTNSRQNGLYYIRSHQTVISRENKRTTLDVNEYFSLTRGFSYSVYQDVDGWGEYALVSDGKQDRSYIIRNPSEEDQEKLACELDTVHTHRQVFPWQFNYDLASNNSSISKSGDSFNSKRQQKNKRKSNWSTKRSVYGVGAIWLNAIELNVVSDKVGDKSPYSTSQPWIISNKDLDIELLFAKPEGPINGFDEMQTAIDTTRLVSVHIKRRLSIDSNSEFGYNIVGASASEIIEIDEFMMDLNPADDGVQRMYAHLRHCRKANQEHKVFPSLLRALSLSSKHMYELDYLETRFGIVANNRADNKYRTVRNPELIFELFSLTHETQVIDYQGVLNQTTNLYDDRIDTYHRRFTERANGLRNTRHATVEYHIVTQDNKEETCTINEPDPPPYWFNLLLRPFRFSRPNDIQITGVLTGLGALLMNANDIHYKQFNLLQKTIEVVYDAANINSRIKLKVDEWRLDDRGGKRVHFYFKRPSSARAKYDLTSLVRIEVRDIKQEQSTSVIENASNDNLADDDLLIRWDILGFYVDTTDESFEYFFNKPSFCPASKKPTDKDNDDTSEGGKDLTDYITEPPYLLPEDEQSSEEEITSPEYDEDKNENEEEKEGEDLEFEPGMMNEGIQIPDFFEQFDGGRVAFTALTKIELISTDPNSKVLYLKESVDMDSNIARLSIYFDIYHDKSSPNLEYYLNYNSELELWILNNKCLVVKELQSWLRLFSVDLPYWRKNELQNVIEESHKLRLYGIGALWRYATMSGDAKYIGKTKLLTGEKGEKYKRLYWRAIHDGDINMKLLYDFQLDIIDAEESKERRNNSLSLKSIQFDNFHTTDGFESSMHNINLTVLSFEKVPSLQLRIPDICKSALQDASKSIFHMNSVLPTLEDYLGDAAGYTIQYYLTKANRSEGEGVHLDMFTETYNFKTRRGKITSGSGDQTKEVFVDRTNNCIYLFAQNTCKLLSTIVAFDTGLDLIDFHHDSESESLFGLANIWNFAKNLKDPVRETNYGYDKLGERMRQSIYFMHSVTRKATVKVQFQFNLIGDDLFDLDKIEITEILATNKISTLKLSKISIQVVNMRKIVEDATSWNLPDECSRLCEKPPTSDDIKPSSQPSILNELPKLTNIIASKGKFYMRSEVILSESFQLLDKFKNNHIIDEWYLNGNYRIKSFGLRKNFEEIIYPTSNEHFEVGEENLCKSNHLTSNSPLQVLQLSALLKLWKASKDPPESLDDYHFGPVSIWKLAEANKNSLKIISSIDLTPKGETMKDPSKALELEMGKRVWRLSHPDGIWYSDLEFLKQSAVDPATWLRNYWLVLNRITVTQVIGSIQYTAQIDVVNYSYLKKDDLAQQKILLPEGYGCQRSSSEIDNLPLVLQSVDLYPALPHFILYESSLEKTALVDNGYGMFPNLTKSILPSVEGSLYRIYKSTIEPHVIIRTHFNTIRYPNGTRESFKTVHDTLNNIDFRIDRITGNCAISLNENKWTIQYPTEDNDIGESLVLDEDMFDHLFMRLGNFQPLNTYEQDGTVYISYEEAGDNLVLTSGLSGPYSIIRRFEYNKGLEKYGVKKFRSLIVKVYMFDKKRIAKKAILTLNLRTIKNISIFRILEVTDVSTCFNKGDDISENPIRIFAIEYNCRKTNAIPERRSPTAIKDAFSILLMEQTKIHATQLVGAPELEMNDSGMLKFTFRLIDAPTFIYQDVEHNHKKRMYTKYEAHAQIKITQNLMECSRLCDKLKCFALGYCSNHFCYILTFEDIRNVTMTRDDLLHDDEDCDYYYLENPIPPTVDSLVEMMDEINSDEGNVERFPLWTRMYCGLLYPEKFIELTEPEELDLATGMHMSNLESRYNEIGRNKKLDLSKLDELQEKGFKHSLECAESVSSCIKHCEVQNCVMVSFCKKNIDGCVVVTGSGDIKELADTVIESDESHDECLVMARDYTSEFKEFTNTGKPDSSVMEYQGYSDKECAAMCIFSDSNLKQKCLSFDHCLSRSPNGSKASCFIQKTHMYSQEFEKTIFESNMNNLKPRNSQDADSNQCQHFSRSLIADYQILEGKKPTVKYSQIEQDIEAERCAYNCNNDNDCYAFVHCTGIKGGSCLILRNDNERQFTSNDEALKYLNQESQESKTCSIYVNIIVPEVLNLNTSTNTYFWGPLSVMREEALKRLDEKYESIKSFVKLIVYLHVALIGGIVVQVMILRVRSML